MASSLERGQPHGTSCIEEGGTGVSLRTIVLTFLLAIAMIGTTSCGDCGGSSETPPSGETTAKKPSATTCKFLLDAIKNLVRQIERLESIPNTLDSESGSNPIEGKCDELKAGIKLYNKEGCTEELPSTPNSCK